VAAVWLLMLYETLLGDRFTEPFDADGFVAWLIVSPLSPGERVQLKKDFEFLTGFTFPTADFDKIRGANNTRLP
jgi:hypothetical protein